ncbi:MAG: transposase [Syntrophomonadaceae bacterium]|nr:transposase [Syntrophomonadaceae bacterium]
MEKRNRYTAEFKANVVLELLREESTLNQVAAKYQLNPQMLSQWKSDFIKNASMVFEHNKDEAGNPGIKTSLVSNPMRLTGSKKNLASSSTIEVRKAMADHENRRIKLARQAYLLTVNRSSLYRQPPTNRWSQTDLDDMRLIDEIYTKCPFYGYRRITAPDRRNQDLHGWKGASPG